MQKKPSSFYSLIVLHPFALECKLSVLINAKPQQMPRFFRFCRGGKIALALLGHSKRGWPNAEKTTLVSLAYCFASIRIRKQAFNAHKCKTSANAEVFSFLSGRQDSNLRPPGPKPGAITGLRYAPNGLQIYNNLQNDKKPF